jgi:hypothetical protein
MRIALALLALFALLVALRVHGFSLAGWHDVIDGSAASEVLIGEPRPIRSDDWKVHLPLVLAQRAASPAFPVINPNVGGLGQDMRIPIETPVLHWSTLFRPTLWGYFLGADVGLAWHWWSRALGLFGVWLAVFAVVARGRLGVAALGAALLVASPFFQFWALNAAPHATALGACFLAVTALLRAATPRRIAAAALGLGLAGGWLALTVYPPYQITLAWLGVALALGFALDRRSDCRSGARGACAPARCSRRSPSPSRSPRPSPSRRATRSRPCAARCIQGAASPPVARAVSRSC